MAGPMDDPGNEEPPLKAKKSVISSFLRSDSKLQIRKEHYCDSGQSENYPAFKDCFLLRFTNKTARRVDIVWVNYEGARVKYRTLTPNQFLDINTFVGHPWIFFDADTGDRMVVQLKEVFEPVPWNSEGDNWPPRRKVINITIPVFTLQDCCLQTLRSLVPRNRIEELDITDILKEDLHRLFRNTTLRRQNALVT